jgi:hypothetical protein
MLEARYPSLFSLEMLQKCAILQHISLDFYLKNIVLDHLNLGLITETYA